MDIDFLDIVFMISFIGISYYAIWVAVLIIHSIKDPVYDTDFTKIDPQLRLYVLIPMLNEAGVVNQTLSQFLKQTHHLPQVRLGVLDDASDDGTGELIQQFIIKHQCEDKIKLMQRSFPNAQTGKGDALNYGLNIIRQEGIDENNTIVGVLDADAIMKEEDFKKVLLQFSLDHELSLLQTKVRMIHTANWLQKMQDIEFATINDWIQRVRNKINNAAASGNGQFIRMAAVKNNVAPWGNALLEDFEFSTNFLLDNKKTFYRTDIVVYQEAVNKIRPFIRQRSRWVQGGLDCTVKYMKPIISSRVLSFWAKFEMVFFMFLPFMTLFVGISNAIAVIFAFRHIRLFKNLILWLIGLNFMLAIYTAGKYCYDNRKINLRIIWACGGMIIYNIILFPAIIIAFYRKITGNKQWIKTTHGVSTAPQSS